MVTITGLICIPLALASLAMSWRYRLALLFIMALLSDAAVANLGFFGLQPGYFMALVLAAWVVAQALLQRDLAIDRTALRCALLLMVLFAAGLLGIFLASAFFGNDVMVLSGRQMFNLDLAEHYSFRIENINQNFYLLANVAVLILLSNALVRLPKDEFFRCADTAIIVSLLFAAFFMLYDLASHSTGIPFPGSFFHSNAFYADAHDQAFGNMPRISGPFAEPSKAAYWFGGFLFYATIRYGQRRDAASLLLVMLALLCLTISTSTTAYFIILVWSPIFLFLLARRQMYRLADGGRINRYGIVVALIPVAAVGFAAHYYLSHRQDVETVYESALANKTETGSFAERTAVDKMGLSILVETYGLGIGLGSHKPNSLLVTLLSNTGIIGTAAFGLFLFSILRRRRTRRLGDAAPLQAFTIGLLITHAISNPNLSGQPLWLALTLNVTAVALAKRAAFEAGGPVRPAMACRLGTVTTSGRNVWRGNRSDRVGTRRALHRKGCVWGGGAYGGSGGPSTLHSQ